MTTTRAQPGMAGDSTRAGTALNRLRVRWLAPSPPLAVDDEPQWSPPPDPGGAEEAAGEGESDRPAVAPLRS
jgi:hypothetical protein